MEARSGLQREKIARVIARDDQVLERAASALEQSGQFSVDGLKYVDGVTLNGTLKRPCNLLVLELCAPFDEDLAALETIRESHAGPNVVVVADDVGSDVARRLLKLNVSDWLPRSFSRDEMIMAANQVAVGADDSADHGQQSLSVAFMPVLGGVGASTLSTMALEILCRRQKLRRSACCLVDLNFHSGTISDYLNVPANLNLAEIIASPERLDMQLIEIMLSEHDNGYAVLCSDAQLDTAEQMKPAVVGKLLDLIAARFGLMVIDMPSIWSPWLESVVRGVDRFYLVSDMSVAGLRHAARQAGAKIQGPREEAGQTNTARRGQAGPFGR